MQTYVALLYSIVLGEGRRVVMADLKAMAADLGRKNPRTLVATGNLVFETQEMPVSALESRLEAAFEKTFGRHVDIVVRDAASWRRLVSANPFPDESIAVPDQVAVRVMRQPVPDEAASRLGSCVGKDERMQVVAGDIWIFFSPRDTQFTACGCNQPQASGTSRNWNTVRKLAEMIGWPR